MHIDYFLNYILKEKRYSKHTFIGYQKDLLDFEAFCEKEFECSSALAKPKMVRFWFSTLMDSNHEARTVRRKSSSLKSYYKYLIKTNVIVQSPMETVPLPKLSKKLPKFVEEKNMNFLLDQVPFENDFTGCKEKFVIELLYHTGIRLSELINIELNDVNLELHQVKVLGKRNKERIVPFSSQFNETIKNYLSYRYSDTNFLLVTEKGNKMYPKMVYRIVNNYLSKVTTLTQKSPHVLRHSFATHMLNNGAELNAIKELLGHVNLSATQVYTHNSLEKIKSVYKQAHPRA